MSAAVILPGIKDFLEADATVAALVGTKIYGGELPNSEVANMPQDCVVIHLAGGGAAPRIGASTIPISRPRYDFKCYGQTVLTAMQLYAAVHSALRCLTQQVINNTVLYAAIMEAGPVNLRDADGQWPFVFAVYTIASADDTAT